VSLHQACLEALSMAITRHLAELLLAEHKHRPIRGETLLLGRQLVVMTPEEAMTLVEKMGIKQLSTAHIDYDKSPHPFPKKLISDVSFFSLFSDSVVQACDVSAYEGADIVFNLMEGVPPSLMGRFDFIYNGSVLDNVFDPAACIRNVSRMLKPDAAVFHYEGAVHSSPAYLKFTLDWFFDYYALNGFSDFQGCIVTYDDVHVDPWRIYEWNAFTPDRRLTMPMKPPNEAMVIAIAQNAPAATICRTPLQNVYRSAQHEEYLAAFERFVASPRRGAIRNLFSNASVAVAPSGQKAQWPKFLRTLFSNSDPMATDAVPEGHVYLGKLGSTHFLGEPVEAKR
jgi:hypothetical protein